MSPGPRHKNGLCKNEWSYSSGAFAQFDRVLHSMKVLSPWWTASSLNRLHSDWRVNNVQNDTNRFGLDVAQYPWTRAGAHVLSHKSRGQSRLIPPRVRREFSYTSENGGKPCPHLPFTRMRNRDQYRMSVRWVFGLALEESKIHTFSRI